MQPDFRPAVGAVRPRACARHRRHPASVESGYVRCHFTPSTLTCRAVLFEMDGTLVDSTCVVERAWSRWAKRHDIPLDAVLSFSHGRPNIATMEYFLPCSGTGRDGSL